MLSFYTVAAVVEDSSLPRLSHPKSPGSVRAISIFFAVLSIPLLSSADAADPGTGQLQFKKLSKDTVLITKGFDYDARCKLSKPCEVTIDGSPTGKTTCGMALNVDTGRLTPQTFCVGAKWTFTKEGLTFDNEGITYTSERPGATVEYTNDGVLMKGMQFTPPRSK